jgi:hypothetical protein
MDASPALFRKNTVVELVETTSADLDKLDQRSGTEGTK